MGGPDQRGAGAGRGGSDVRIDPPELSRPGHRETACRGCISGPNVVEMEARGIETDKGNAGAGRPTAQMPSWRRRRGSGAAAREERAAVLADLERRKAADAERAAVQSHQEDVTYERARPEPERESGRAGVARVFQVFESAADAAPRGPVSSKCSASGSRSGPPRTALEYARAAGTVAVHLATMTTDHDRGAAVQEAVEMARAGWALADQAQGTVAERGRGAGDHRRHRVGRCESSSTTSQTPR